MFIIDSDNRLIAAEKADLKRWGYPDLYEAAQAFRAGQLRLDREGSRLTMENGEEVECQSEKMESLLGAWVLCSMAEKPIAQGETPQQTPAPVPLSTTETPEEDLLEILSLEEPEKDESLNKPAPIHEENPQNTPDEDILSSLTLKDEEEPKNLRQETLEPLSLFPEPEEKETPPTGTTEEEEILQLLEEAEVQESSPTDQENDNAEESASHSLASVEEEKFEATEPLIEELFQDSDTLEEATPTSLEPIPEEETQVPTPVISIPETKQAPWEALEEEFHPSLSANAEMMELNEHEYADLVEEFIQDSRSMHAELLDPDSKKRQYAVAILKDAVGLLHLGPLDRLLGMIEEVGADEREEPVHSYERLLEKLEKMLEPLHTDKEALHTVEESLPSSGQPSTDKETPAPANVQPQAELSENEAVPKTATSTPSQSPSSAEAVESSEQAEISPSTEALGAESFLEGTKPVPIEFSLHIAAEELNLPEDLVLEFINDFAKQGHEYLPVLIEAYQNKDLEQLQKTAHMLKGAASNLRIEAMVDNLYDLQFDKEIERAPQRIRLFAGQLMSLDKYLEQMNK